MKKYLLATSAASLALAYHNETCEVVLTEGPNGPVRVNKSDFDADQEKPAKERQYKPYSGKEEPEQSDPSSMNATQPSDVPLAAPSAPNFSGENAEGAALIDPLKNAVAPTTASPNQMLVMKKGKKYLVVDGTGQPITDKEPLIDPKGYDTEDLAWKAIKDAPH